MLRRVRKIAAAALIAAAPFGATLATTGIAHAASATEYKWTGASSSTAGLNGCSTNCWSVAGNWDTSTDGGTTWATATNAPASTDNSGAGDNLVFDNSLLRASESTTNDIANLTVGSISTLTGGANNYSYTVAGPLTITGGSPAGAGNQVVLNGAATLKGTQAFGTATSGSAVQLNGDVTVATGTVTEYDSLNANSLAVASGATLKLANGGNLYGLTGSGAIDLLTPTGTNVNYPTYANMNDSGSAASFSGAIDVQKGVILTASGNNPANALGSAALTVENGGQLKFSVYPTNPATTATLTVPNAITVSGNGAGVDQMEQGAIMGGLYDSSKSEEAGTLTVNFSGNVTLAGDTSLSSIYATAATFNFAKLAQNGHVLSAVTASAPTYGVTTVQVNGKTVAGGAAGSSAGGSTKAPGTPDTGFALTSAKTTPVLAITVLAAITLFFAARHLKPATKR